MSREVLRRAADKALELANGATSGPWAVAPNAEDGVRNVVYSEFLVTRYGASVDTRVAQVFADQRSEEEDSRWGQTTDADYIAALPPEVVDALAAWFTAAEEYWGHDAIIDQAALAVATAYVGTWGSG